MSTEENKDQAGQEDAGRAEDFFGGIGRQLDNLMDRIREKTPEVKQEVEERMDEIKDSAKRLEEEVEKLWENGEWKEELRERAEHVSKEIRDAFEGLGERLKGKKKNEEQ